MDNFARTHGVTLKDANETMKTPKGLILIQLDSGRSMRGERWETAVSGVDKLMKNVSDQMSKISFAEEKSFIFKNGANVEGQKLKDWFETINDDFTDEHIDQMMALAAQYSINMNGKTQFKVAEFCKALRE
jgi:hypothetical protein